MAKYTYLLTYLLTYNKQRNFCVSLLRKEKKEYFAKLYEKDITDNRKFRHTVKPFLSDKVKSRETTTLVNKENIESNENSVAKIFNDFSSNILKNLKIQEYECEDDLHNRLFSHPALQAPLNIGITQALITLGIPNKGSQAFLFRNYMLMNFHFPL